MPEETVTTPPAEVTTPPAAETTVTTPPVTTEVDYKAEAEKLQAKYSAAQADLAKFRTRDEQVKTAEAAAETERLRNAPLEDRLKALEAERATEKAELVTERAARTAAERKAALTGKVIDPDAALRLLDDEFITDGTVDTDAFLKKFPFLAPAAVPTDKPRTPPANPGGKSAGAGLTKQAIGEMSAEEYQKRLPEIMTAMRNGSIK